jgi:hypothetical protein
MGSAKGLKELQVNWNDQESDVKLCARRRLIRGAFGVPAVLTLYSGSALAMTSSKRCLVNAVNSPPVTPSASPGPDTWVRVQLHEVPSTTQGGDSNYWLSGAMLPSNRNFLPGSKVQEFSISENKLKGNDPLGGRPSTDLPSTATLGGDKKRWVALRLDADGSFVGAGLTGPTNSAPLTNLCFSSFIAGGM